MAKSPPRKKTPTEDLPFAKQPPLITILSDHAVAGREKAELNDDDVSFIADKDLLTLESRLSSTFDILRHRNTQCPMAIAVYGDWGTGKTSAMRWLETQLKTWNDTDTKREGHPRAYPVWFDPWRYHTKEEVWRGIIAEVILSLFHVSSLDREHLLPRMVQAAKKFGGFLGRSFIHALAHMKVEVEPEVLGTKVGKVSYDGEAFRDIWQEYERAEQPHKAHLNHFEDTLRTWVTDYLSEDKKLGTEDARIVLFIDDLDRCLPEVALEVLEALKLYLNIPHLIFVVGLDRDVVNAAVGKRYKDMGVAEDKARHYLHKIFQVELTIPPSEAQMGEFMERQIDALDAATDGYWRSRLRESGYQDVLESALTELARNNPREVKRLLNSALIRGRAAARDPVLDEKLGATEKARALRFAQGVQVLLLQRLIQDRLMHCENLLILKRHLEWFVRASALLRQALQSPETTISRISDLLERMRQVDAERIISAEAQESVLRTTLEVEWLELGELKKHFSTTQLLDDRENLIDPAIVMTEPWLNLLSVPFSQEVAQSAPRVIGESGQKNTSIQTLLNELPDEAKSRLAGAAGVPVGELTPDHLERIERLDWCDIKGLEQRHLSLMRVMRNLKMIDLRHCEELRDLSPIADVTGLTWLALIGCTKVRDLAPLEGLTGLRVLDLRNCEGVNELGPLAGLTELDHLHLSGCGAITELGPLAKMLGLERLDLTGCVGVSDLSPLAELKKLEWLDISGCVAVHELEPLAGLSALDWLVLHGCSGISDATVEAIKASLPECSIVDPQGRQR